MGHSYLLEEMYNTRSKKKREEDGREEKEKSGKRRGWEKSRVGRAGKKE